MASPFTPPAAVMLLGPSEPLRIEGAPRSVLSDWVTARIEQRNLLRSLGIPTVIMEDDWDPRDRTNTRKFHRLAEERSVRTWSILWPLGAQMNSLDVEFGFLLKDLEKGELGPDQVQLLVEARENADDVRVETGFLEAPEQPTNASVYYPDFAAYGCPIRRWESREGLMDQTRIMALTHGQKYPPGVVR